MADGDVIEGADGQVPAPDDQADETGAGGADEAAAVLLDSGDGTEGGDGAVPGADETPAEPESLETVLARNEALREEFEAKLRERENAGAQRREAQLRRDAGKKEVTRQNVTRFVADLGLDVDDTSRLDYLYDLAAGNAAMEIATAVPEAILRNYQLSADVREKAISARENGDWDGYISTYIEGAVQAKDAEREAAFEKRVNETVQKRVAAEIKARQIEAAPKREGAIPTPGGSAPGGAMTLDDIEKEPMNQWLSRPKEERERLIATAEQMRR